MNEPGGATTSPSGASTAATQVLGRRLSRRAGDTDDCQAAGHQLRGHRGGQPGQRGEHRGTRAVGVVLQNAGRRIGSGIGARLDDDRGDPDGPGRHHPDRSGGHRRSGEVVAVRPRTGKGEKQSAGSQRAGVELDRAGHPGRRGVGGRHVGELTADDVGDLGEGQIDHAWDPSVSRDPASSSRSSNGLVCPWLVCPASWPFPAISTTSPARAHATAWSMASRRSPISTTSRGAARGARDDRRSDRGGILIARVVVGHDNQVGQFGGHPAHRLALARVTVAAGTEHHRDAAGGLLAQRLQYGAQRPRLVRVVDQCKEALPTVDGLQPAWHPRIPHPWRGLFG